MNLLLFLTEHGPLQPWERDVLSMLREEAYYFAPQGQTKILNEGWASYWHTTIMTQKALDPSEVIDYADRHSGTMGMQPGSINPYKLGLELFRDIEDRWNKGRFGKEWEECDDLVRRKNWNTDARLGREKIFEIRKHYNDVTFIDEFLTPEFAEEHRLFNYAFNKKTNNWEIATREFRKIKEKLLFQLTNYGQPFIWVIDGNFENRGELLLKHQYEGIDLRQDYCRDVLYHLYGMWTRPVGIHTQLDDRKVIVRFDGQDYSEVEAEAGL
jgi:stage V sporulation protein R